jgi:hypothetical protein
MLPTTAAVLEYYDAQPHHQKNSRGFTRGTVSRAAFIDWYLAQIPDGFTSPRGHVRTTRQEKRFQALYHLERALMGRERAAE